jgi:hypothetical protein
VNEYHHHHHHHHHQCENAKHARAAVARQVPISVPVLWIVDPHRVLCHLLRSDIIIRLLDRNSSSAGAKRGIAQEMRTRPPSQSVVRLESCKLLGSERKAIVL